MLKKKKLALSAILKYDKDTIKIRENGIETCIISCMK